MSADLDFRFEGETYHIVALTDRGQRWLAAEGLSEITKTVSINKIREAAMAAGLQTLVEGNAYKRGYSLQERPEDPDLKRQNLLRGFATPFLDPESRWIAQLNHQRAEDRALVEGALSDPAERCPYKRNTTAGRRLAVRWHDGRAIAAELRQ